MERRKLPRSAYDPKPGERYVPFTAGQSLTEFTVKAVVSGALLGMLFGAANTYLGLKAGLTISTSIPVAVLTVVAFKLIKAMGFGHSILELNTSQTVGSASSSVASGVLFTIPALYLWGLDPEWRQLTLLAMAGGLIGVLAMVPLRRYLIDREHGNLPYPEGMACAEVLVAAEHGGKQSAGVFWGLGIGFLFKWITGGLKLIAGKLTVPLVAKAELSVAVSPALIGVGYILGPRIATVMVAGSALSVLVIVPLINWWGSDLSAPFYPETERLIRDMSAGDLRDRYVRYIGAGAVAAAGIMTLIKSIPTMVESFKLGIKQIGSGASTGVERTDRDLSFRVVLSILAVVLLVLTLVPGILGFLDSVVVRGLAALLIAVFAFFFVTVSARIVGLVGVTSNPTSGMTIATLLGTSTIFLAMGWTDLAGKATALMVGTAVAIAASIAGDTSQDLKTGFVLGATPRFQQIGELIGVITSAGVVCWVIGLLHKTTEGGLGGEELPAPQGVLMQLILDGVLERTLPWSLIFIGVGIAVVASFFRVPVLAFAVGVYLPLSTMAALFLGGVTRHYLTRAGGDAAEGRREQGVLLGSGMVGGEGLMGVVLAVWVLARDGQRIVGFPPGLSAWSTGLLATVGISAIVALLVFFANRRHD